MKLLFKWINNAKGNAGVTVISKFFSIKIKKNPLIFRNGVKMEVDSINAYLISGNKDLMVSSKTNSICGLPKINHGNMPADGGKFLFSNDEKETFLLKEPRAERWFYKIATAKEHLNGRLRWCLWLEDASLNEIESLPLVYERVKEVKAIRELSSRPQLADIPHLFAQITQPKNKSCVIIPRVSSENRNHLPVDFLDGKEFKVTDSFFTIATNEPYIFGIIGSRIHMVWMKSVGGKLETRIQYSKNVIYNTFPFPTISKQRKEELTQCTLKSLMNA